MSWRVACRTTPRSSFPVLAIRRTPATPRTSTWSCYDTSRRTSHPRHHRRPRRRPRPRLRRTEQLLAAGQAHIASRQWDSAEVALSEALDTAPYIMDSSWAYVWRGVLEYQRGHYQLARLSLRRALVLYPDPGVRGLDTISPGLANLLDVESRAIRTFRAWDLDQPVRWLTVPQFVYPRELRRRRVSGPAVVRMLVDTLGRVDDRNIEILETPDSGFSTRLKQTLSSVLF